MKVPGSLVLLVALAGCGDEPTGRMDAAVLEGEWMFSFEEAELDCEPETGGGT